MSIELGNSSRTAASNREFKHFMLKEIHEQPDVVQACLEAFLADELGAPAGTSSKSGFPDLTTDFYASLEQVQIVACGTSLHASLVGQYLLEQLAGIPTLVRYASEVSDAPLPLTVNTLMIGVTQSGETADTLAALRALQERHPTKAAYQVRSLGITNQLGSALESQVQDVLHTPAGQEVGVAATKTFVAQLMAFYALAIKLAVQRQRPSQERLQEIRVGLQQIPSQIATILQQQEPYIAELASRWTHTQDCIVLGRGINYPIALEGALKLKETSYIHAEGYPAGEFMHGPVAMLDAQIPVVAIALPGQAYAKVLANAQKAKASGAALIGITSTPQAPEIIELFDQVLTMPTVDELLSPLLSIIPLQLLAYYVAASRGLDVDRPRNIQKFLGNG